LEQVAREVLNGLPWRAISRSPHLERDLALNAMRAVLELAWGRTGLTPEEVRALQAGVASAPLYRRARRRPRLTVAGVKERVGTIAVVRVVIGDWLEGADLARWLQGTARLVDAWEAEQADAYERSEPAEADKR
jgi:hypothetical protein